MTCDKKEKKAFHSVGEESTGFGLRSLSTASFETSSRTAPGRRGRRSWKGVLLIQLRFKAHICPKEKKWTHGMSDEQ